jgi:hypothetical protein
MTVNKFLCIVHEESLSSVFQINIVRTPSIRQNFVFANTIRHCSYLSVESGLQYLVNKRSFISFD